MHSSSQPLPERVHDAAPADRCAFVVAAITDAADRAARESGHSSARTVTLEVGADPGTLVAQYLTAEDGTRLEPEGPHLDQMLMALAELAEHPYEEWAAYCAAADDRRGVYELDARAAEHVVRRLHHPAG
ncbi:hypothetical protein ABT354_20015 [Streptomyces sp. NPDC000594]|uniref:hypothetical protein n=1 Tax=Streptomyces sp. NPDC000594 TaxID=3154261 RepID=UPI00332C306A